MNDDVLVVAEGVVLVRGQALRDLLRLAAAGSQQIGMDHRRRRLLAELVSAVYANDGHVRGHSLPAETPAGDTENVLRVAAGNSEMPTAHIARAFGISERHARRLAASTLGGRKENGCWLVPRENIPERKTTHG